MRTGIIDLGTNSIRFDVYSILPKGKAKLLHREKQMIRLGQDIFLKGRFHPGALDRAIRAFDHFAKIADSMRVRKIIAFGTSALREANDSQALIEKVKERTGIELKAITGEGEAKLIALGVLSNERCPKGSFALVDIGGGSTEISICRNGRVVSSHSFPLGTARLQQVFLKKSPPKPSDVQQLRSYIYETLKQIIKKKKWKKVSYAIGSSGTAKAISKILTLNPFPYSDLEKLILEMKEMSTTQLLGVQGMESKRVDMILSGSILLEEICAALGIKRIQFTDFSLRDGIIEEELKLNKRNVRSKIELHYDDLYKIASRFNVDVDWVKQVEAEASILFNKLHSVHRLDRKWKVYLISALILRKCGEVVSFSNRDKHTYYLVKNVDLPSFENWEAEFVALLCRFLHSNKIERKDLITIKGAEKKKAFESILALLKIVDSFDLGPDLKMTIRSIKILRNKIEISVSGKGASVLDEVMVERKLKYFENLFGRELVFKRFGRLR
ncbi:MAG: Ppx/GppA family phosphatase [Oligoflexia bacterium]|nr:Ppx/GppA family phosphatase [Oligoflexia bacterium]